MAFPQTQQFSALSAIDMQGLQQLLGLGPMLGQIDRNLLRRQGGRHPTTIASPPDIPQGDILVGQMPPQPIVDFPVRQPEGPIVDIPGGFQEQQERIPVSEQGPQVLRSTPSGLSSDPDELDRQIEQERTKDDRILVQLFGEEGAKRYKRLERTANSTSDPSRADAAQEELETIQDGLTPEQQNRLFGIGETGPSLDDLQETRRAVGSVESETPDDIGQALAEALPGRAESPAQAAKVQRAIDLSNQRGFSKQQVINATQRAFRARFQDPEDAEFMLRSVVRELR